MSHLPFLMDPFLFVCHAFIRILASLKLSFLGFYPMNQCSCLCFIPSIGFVVDARRGLILTNAHVVRPGPVVATAIFANHEEADVHAVYSDPEHDFGYHNSLIFSSCPYFFLSL